MTDTELSRALGRLEGRLDAFERTRIERDQALDRQLAAISSKLDRLNTAFNMDEIGIDISRHRSKSFDNLDDTSFDLIVSLSPEAHHRALEMTRAMACEVEFWNTFDPSIIEGSREVRLDAYRAVRDTLLRRIRERFPVHAAPTI